MFELCSLATEGTQEFPPLKKSVSHKYRFIPNILSHSDKASCILAVFDAAELQILQNGGKFHRTKEVPQTTIWLSKDKLPFYLALHILKVYGFVGLEIFG